VFFYPNFRSKNQYLLAQGREEGLHRLDPVPCQRTGDRRCKPFLLEERDDMGESGKAAGRSKTRWKNSPAAGFTVFRPGTPKPGFQKGTAESGFYGGRRRFLWLIF
jgi:hypothetical protein